MEILGIVLVGAMMAGAIATIVVMCTMMSSAFDEVDLWVGVTVEKDVNDGKKALAAVLNLVEDAQGSLEVFDDGNPVEDSIYDKDALVDAVRQKLETHPKFEVTCYFNADARERRFCEELFDHDRVTIYDSLELVPRNRSPEEHYKIIDGGRRGYVTEHGFDERRRESTSYNATGLPDREIRAKAKILYGNMRKKRAFQTEAQSADKLKKAA